MDSPRSRALSLSPRRGLLARGMFGLLRYNATATLHTILVPVLIVVGDWETATTLEASNFMCHQCVAWQVTDAGQMLDAMAPSEPSRALATG